MADNYSTTIFPFEFPRAAQFASSTLQPNASRAAETRSAYPLTLWTCVRMAKAKLPVTAACVCGKIELCADEQPLVVYLCHCMRCQTTSGTDYQHNARFEPGQVWCGFQRVGCKRFALRPYALMMCSQQTFRPVLYMVFIQCILRARSCRSRREKTTSSVCASRALR